MKRISSLDLSLVLSLAAVAGLALAAAGLWLGNGRLGVLVAPGLALVYLAGGIPAAGRAHGRRRRTRSTRRPDPPARTRSRAGRATRRTSGARIRTPR